MKLEERAKHIASEANECCNRSDGYEEGIEDLALQHLAHVASENKAERERLLRLLQWCRARLKKPAYQTLLDDYIANPREPDFETKLILAND